MTLKLQATIFLWLSGVSVFSAVVNFCHHSLYSSAVKIEWLLLVCKRVFSCCAFIAALSLLLNTWEATCICHYQQEQMPVLDLQLKQGESICISTELAKGVLTPKHCTAQYKRWALNPWVVLGCCSPWLSILSDFMRGHRVPSSVCTLFYWPNFGYTQATAGMLGQLGSPCGNFCW